MSKVLHVTKSDGTLAPLDYDKINKILEYACDGIDGVSPSLIAMSLNIKFFNKIKTSEIHDAAIKTAADLITAEEPNYQYVAARLLNYKLRKQVYGQYQPIRFYDHIVKVTKLGFYDSEILELYTEQDIDKLEKHINHDNDELFTYSAMKLFEEKYLVRNRHTKQILETPQFAYMLVAMVLFGRDGADNQERLKLVIDYYNLTCGGPKSLISLPTPINSGVRTPTRQFSSCVGIKGGDSLESMNAASAAITSYAANRAGIGVDLSSVRGLGAPIRSGEVVHTGVTPFIKMMEAAVNSASQGGVRKGSGTLTYCIWHPEIENMLVLKNNKGSEDTRARNLDYSVQLNGHFYKKAMAREEYCLFHPNQVPDLYEAFFVDQDKFAELYDKYSRSKRVAKRVQAFDLLVSLVSERIGTGRVYITNVDNVNNQSAFNDVVYQSNLCQEISLPSKPLTRFSNLTLADAKQYGIYDEVKHSNAESFGDQFGEIFLCTLSGINFGNIKKPSDLEKPMYYAIRALDNLISYQDYPMIAAEVPGKARRSLGIGIINLAHFFAKRGWKYGDNLAEFDEYMEAMYYYGMKATIELAKERGACEWSKNTIYSNGEFVFQHRSPNLDKLVEHQERFDWAELSELAKQYGVRNSTIMAMFPAETSALISNSTNGIEPPRAVVTTKGGKGSTMKQVVPNPKLKYDYLWDQKTPEGYLNVMAVIQKWTDQAISVNLSYNPEHYPEGKLNMAACIKDILTFWKLGGKNIYYANQKIVDNDEQTKEPQEDCESCKL